MVSASYSLFTGFATRLLRDILVSRDGITTGHYYKVMSVEQMFNGKAAKMQLAIHLRGAVQGHQ
jgi:hypothetical protein